MKIHQQKRSESGSPPVSDRVPPPALSPSCMHHHAVLEGVSTDTHSMCPAYGSGAPPV
ncbi:hypothetical protein L195_g039715 [Trifolium pratense]|uniref:Uncharacterized protein n=1 Tax=Trifolium pratense TaxID=57577 RepID=A0A2K3LYQ6_TRIPR|nr:hypothetical protein L195_g039715 [Trifolium pratense]